MVFNFVVGFFKVMLNSWKKFFVICGKYFGYVFEYKYFGFKFFEDFDIVFVEIVVWVVFYVVWVLGFFYKWICLVWWFVN